MTLYLEATTTIPDLFIDYIEVRLASGESASLFCDVIDAGVTEKNNQLDAKVSQLSTKDRKTVYDVLDLLVRDLSK